MPKSSKEQIDLDEKKVIRELEKNAKESIDRIAQKCGCSRQKVWRIMKRLEGNKTIWGYTAVADDEKLNKKRYLMLFKQSSKPLGDAINKIINLTTQKKVEEIGIDVISGGYIHGSYDWVVIFTAKNIINAKRFKEILTATYPELISEVEIMEYVFPLKECGIVNPEIEKLREFFI